MEPKEFPRLVSRVTTFPWRSAAVMVVVSPPVGVAGPLSIAAGCFW